MFLSSLEVALGVSSRVTLQPEVYFLVKVTYVQLLLTVYIGK